MKNKMLKLLLSSSMLAIMLLLGTSFNAYAQTTDIVVRDSSGRLCQYSYQDLRNSLMDDKVLFNEFKTRKVIAYKDDISGYVDFNYIKDIYMNTDKKSFNLKNVTESAPTQNLITISENIVKRLMGVGGVADGETITPGNSDDLQVIDIS